MIKTSKTKQNGKEEKSKIYRMRGIVNKGICSTKEILSRIKAETIEMIPLTRGGMMVEGHLVLEMDQVGNKIMVIEGATNS